jgi:hypothetical protein
MAAQAAQGVMSHQAQAAAASANADAAKFAAMSEYRQLNMQQRQEQKIAAQRKMAASLQEGELLARGRVAAGEAGVQGRSVDDVLANISRGSLEEQNVLTQNLEAYNRQLDEQRIGVQSRAQSRINQVARPSFLGSALSTGAAMGGSLLASGKSFADVKGDFSSMKIGGTNISAASPTSYAGEPTGSMVYGGGN